MDKTSKKIIKYIKSLPNCEYHYNKGIQNILPHEEFARCIEFMVANDYVSPIYSNGIVIGYSLTHKIAHRKEFSLIALRDYLIKNWIAVVALILSIINFVEAHF